MENVGSWHGKGPNKEEADAALAEIDAVINELEGK